MVIQKIDVRDKRTCKIISGATRTRHNTFISSTSIKHNLSATEKKIWSHVLPVYASFTVYITN
jgi:hypothetical protein